MMPMITMMLMMLTMLVIAMMWVVTLNACHSSVRQTALACAPPCPRLQPSHNPELLTRPGRRDTCPRSPATPQQPLPRQPSNWPTTLGETSSSRPCRIQVGGKLYARISAAVYNELDDYRRVGDFLLRLSSSDSPPASLLVFSAFRAVLLLPSSDENTDKEKPCNGI